MIGCRIFSRVKRHRANLFGWRLSQQNIALEKLAFKADDFKVLSTVLMIKEENKESKVNKNLCNEAEFCALRLISWSMCLTDESVQDKLQRIITGYLAA